MLAFYFFSLVFFSILWLIYILSYINDKLGSVPFKVLGLTDMSVYLALTLLPLLVLWLIFGYINQYLAARANAKNFKLLFSQAKKNQDYTDLLARVLIEAQDQIKNGFALNRFDLLVADLNELLSEIIQGCGIASKEQIEHLWVKVQNGGKWSFGKVIIEISQNQPNFQARLFDKAQRNLVLAGTIMEFCARYQSLTSLLEKHDQEKTFYDMLETGVMGKVYSILAPISSEIHKGKELSARPKNTFTAKPEFFTAEQSIEEETHAEKPSIMSRLGFFKKKKEPIFVDDDDNEPAFRKDPFSLALEKSFGEEEDASEPAPEVFSGRNEPAFGTSDVSEEDSMPAPVISPAVDIPSPQPEKILTNTQKTLNDLKKEWQEMKVVSEQEEKKADEESASFSYPFSGWTDEENYRR